MKICSGDEQESMSELCTFPHIAFSFLQQNPHFTIPACAHKWYKVEIDYEATETENRGLIDLCEFALYQDNVKYPLHVRQILETRSHYAGKSLQEWKKHHVMQLDLESHREWNQYFLPTVFSRVPLVFTKQKLTVSMGEIQREALPMSLTWMTNKGSSVYSESLICQSIRSEHGWVHLNVIKLQSKLSSIFLARQVDFSRQDLKAFMLKGHIYLFDRGQTVSENLFQKLKLGKCIGPSCEEHQGFDTTNPQWDAQLTEAESFKYHQFSSQFMVDRLPHSWIQKYDSAGKKDGFEQDLLQITNKDQSILFKLAKTANEDRDDREKSVSSLQSVFRGEEHKKLVFVEVDQIQNMMDFMCPDEFIPTGFVAKYY